MDSRFRGNDNIKNQKTKWFDWAQDKFAQAKFCRNDKERAGMIKNRLCYGNGKKKS